MPASDLINSRRAIAAFGASLLLALSACTKAPPLEQPMIQKLSDDTLKLSTEAIKNLKLDRVIRGEFADELSIMGRVSVPEDRIAVVPARVAGRIDSVFVTSGEMVGRGQAMASLFSPDFVIAREEYLQTVRQLRTNPHDPEASRLLGLSKKKLESMGVSPGDIESLAKQSEGKSENLTVRSPRGGAILDKKAVVGTFVNQGDTLFTVGDLSKVWFAGDVYPEDLRKIHRDQEVMIDPGNGAGTVFGKVSFISPVIDPTSRTIKIRALMENPGNQLRGDMYVKGSLILSKRMSLIVPKNAVVRLRDSLFAFKSTTPGTFKKVPVEVGSENDGQLTVNGGLNEGDTVVTEGALLLDAALVGGSGK